MKLFQKENGDLEFSEIDPLLAMLMITCFQQQESQWNLVAACFLATPLKEDESFSRDWEEYVQPGLLTLLKSCHGRVLADLEQMKRLQLSQPENLFFTLTIRKAHREAWLRILNVARLSLAAEHQLSDEEISGELLSQLTTPRGQVMLQMQFFSMLQQCLVEAESETM